MRDRGRGMTAPIEIEVKAVEVLAELRQIKTMADGTVNIILNLPEDCIPQVKVLLDWLGLEVRAVITNAPENRKRAGHGSTKKC